jgi:hypothetical protein
VDKTTDRLKKLRSLFLMVTETGLALVGVILVVYLLLGEESGGFVTSVVTNVGLLVEAVSAEAIIGIALVLAVVGLFRSRV